MPLILSLVAHYVHTRICVHISYIFLMRSIGHVFQGFLHIQNVYLVCKDWLEHSQATCKNLEKLKMGKIWHKPQGSKNNTRINIANPISKFWYQLLVGTQSNTTSNISSPSSKFQYQSLVIWNQYQNWYQELEIEIPISPRISHFSCSSSTQLQVFPESSSIVPQD